MAPKPTIIIVDAIPMRTTIRQAISPYLPPPLVQAIHDTIDPALKPFVGDEASITIVGSLLLAYVVYQILKVITYACSSNRKAIRDDDDDNVLTNLSKQQAYQDSVLLLGPSLAGKTKLLYWLCHEHQRNVQTVVSMRPNVGFKEIANNNDNKTIRVLDYPGHLSLQSSILLNVGRVCLVLDSTQPVGPAAEIMYQLLTCLPTKQRPCILICCHKSDLKGSKNHKRIKIQLRSELEHFVNSSQPTWWSPGKPIVWEEIADIAFLSTSCESEIGMVELEQFVGKGILPLDDATSRR